MPDSSREQRPPASFKRSTLRKTLLLLVAFFLASSFILCALIPYSRLTDDENLPPETLTAKRGPRAVINHEGERPGTPASPLDDASTRRWKEKKKYFPNKKTHPLMKDQFGDEANLNDVLRELGVAVSGIDEEDENKARAAADPPRIVANDAKPRGAPKEFLLKGKPDPTKPEPAYLLPIAEGEIGAGRETKKTDVEHSEESAAWRASVALSKGKSHGAASDLEGIAGLVGYAVSKEVPLLRLEKLRYKAPPTHPSYERILSALSDADRDQLEQLRLRYVNESVLEKPECGNWQKRYQKFHRATFRNETSHSRTLMYLCRRTINCGGLADRMLGMVSTFVFALLDDRAFLARWESPILLEALFDAPSVDWRPGFRPGDVERDLAFEEEQGREFSWIHAKAFKVDSTFVNPEIPWREKFPEDHLTFFTNRGMAIRLFNSTVYGPRLTELGLTRDTIFACALDYVVKPKPAILFKISQFVALFELPKIFSVGIQIRTGDSSMFDPGSDRASLALYDPFFTCADQLVDAYAAPGQIVVYYLLTDSAHLRDEAATRYAEEIPDEVPEAAEAGKEGADGEASAEGRAEHHRHRRFLLVSGVPIAHTHRSAKVDGAAGSIVESWALAATNYRIISLGGYGKLAAFHSAAPDTTIVLNPAGNNQIQHLHSRPVTHCGLKDAFTPFAEMAREWSLG